MATSKIKCHWSFFTGLLILVSCTAPQKENDKILEVEVESINQKIENRFPYFINYPVDSTEFPRRYSNEGNIVGVPSSDWTSGFFPGSLFFLYRLTADERYKSRADSWLPYLEKEKWNAGTHDMGFKINCSFGNAYKISGSDQHKKVIVESAKTLISRYNPKVGSIKSWDFGKDRWQYPVIIDNMMNLELLFEATALSGDSTFYEVAVTHAFTTLENHFRADNSSYHVVDYDTVTGEVVNKFTHQGYNDESVWSRGQAWGLYGFIMTYRYTNISAFLNQATNIADFLINHPNMPEDNVPYWDLADPDIPNAPRDASAAAIIASACVELFQYTSDQSYLDFSRDILESLKTEKYVLDEEVDAPFILTKSTGNWPKNEAIEVPIVYADYYFLEALWREIKLDK